MKQTLALSLFLAAVTLCMAFADEDTDRTVSLRQDANAKQEELRQKKIEAVKLAEKLLDGRPVVVRVYGNWQIDPEAYELVSVPLAGLSLSFDSLGSASQQMAESAMIVVLGQDQRDQAVKALLADTVYARVYRKGLTAYLWPPLSEDPGDEWWFFDDALGDPIPEALVDIRILDCSHGAWVSLGKFKLDDQGRLKRLKRINSTSKFVFVVSHPDYGMAKVEAGCCPSLGNPPISYVVPLVPIGSEAGSRAVSGFVTDTEGNPVAGAEIACFAVRAPGAERIGLYTGGIGRALTDEQGWFAMYAPVVEDNKLTSTLIPLIAKYRLNIMPPKFLNLRQYNGEVISGKQASINLTALQADEYFHTFAFEYAEGPITDPQELAKISVELYREGRSWLTLKYDDFKAGTYLPLGKLCASTSRWGNHFSFEPIELAADSPDELVFKARQRIVYRGRVVNGLTGEPMPNVLVLVDHSYSRKDLSSLSPQQWEQLHTQATEQLAAGPLDRKLYDHLNRVALSDANGCYQVIFMPGFNTCLWSFTALEKGYVAQPVSAGYISPGADRIVELPAVKLSPRGSKYFPTLVFEDESGPVTDPEMLGKIQIKVEQPGGGSWHPPTYDHWLRIGEFVPGTYYVTADWHGKRYIFEPVNLAEKRPETVVFKIKQIEPGEIVYQGQVVHGVTGQPVSGAVVTEWRLSGYTDGSDLAPEQWDAIDSVGSELDPKDLALASLKGIFESARIARTKADGWFQISLPNRTNRRYGALMAMKRHFLGALQQFEYRVPGVPDDRERPTYREFEPDANGYVTLPAMKLLPAGTILVEPDAPDFVQDEKHEIRIGWRTSPEDETPWRKGVFATPADNMGGSVLRKYKLQPNQIQSAYIPALVELTIEIYRLGDNRWAPIVIDGVKLEQGQVLDLGRRDFKPTLKVLAKVVGRAGRPVAGALVCWEQADSPFGYGYRGSVTDGQGIASVTVPPYSKGRLVVVYFNRVTKERFEEGIPCEVGDEEDVGKEFTLRLSDKMLNLLFQ